MKYLSAVKGFISWDSRALLSYDAKENITVVTDLLGPVVNKVLAQLPTNVEKNVRSTFKAVMLSTDIWKQKGSEAKDRSQYVNTLLKDAEDPPKLTIPANHEINTDIKKQFNQFVIDQLRSLGVNEADIERCVDSILHYYHAMSEALLLETISRYQNENLDFMTTPSKSAPLPHLKIDRIEGENIFKISVTQVFGIRNCDTNSIEKAQEYETIGNIDAQAVFHVSLMQPEYASCYKVTFFPALVNNLRFEINDYVKSLELPGETYQIKIDDHAFVNIPDQLKKDLKRQAYYIDGDLYYEAKTSNQPFDYESFVKVIYLFTNNNRTLTEDVCKALTQRTFAESTEDVYKKFANDGTLPQQLEKMPPTFQLYKDGEDIKLLSTLYFNLFDMNSMTKSENYVKSKTLINFTTGSASVSYEKS